MPESPAFQFYPGDFLSDENQMVMELAEVGAYIRLMCVCWREGSIPSDVRKLAKLAGTTFDQMAEMWPALAPCFRPHPSEEGRLIHPRLEKERGKQDTYRSKMQEAGRKSGATRREKAKERVVESNQARTKLEPKANLGPTLQSLSLSLSSPAGSTNTVTVEEEVPEQSAPPAAPPLRPESKTANPDLEPLVAFVGEARRFAVEAVAKMRGVGPVWGAGVLATYGPNASMDGEKVPAVDRPEVLGIALVRFASEAKEYSRPYFASFVARAHSDLLERRRKVEKDEQSQGTWEHTRTAVLAKDALEKQRLSEEAAQGSPSVNPSALVQQLTQRVSFPTPRGAA